MKMTLDEYYKMTFTSYYMQFDNDGNFKYGHGVIPYGIYKNAEKELKDYLKTHKRNNDIYCEIVYNNKIKDIVRIYFIGKTKFNKIHIGI